MVASDSPDIVMGIGLSIQRAGHVALLPETEPQMEEMCRLQKPDLVLMDYDLRRWNTDKTGLDLARQLDLRPEQVLFISNKERPDVVDKKYQQYYPVRIETLFYPTVIDRVLAAYFPGRFDEI